MFLNHTHGIGSLGSLDDFAQAIQRVEGYYAPGENPSYPSGTVAYRNNNPGNLIYTSYYAGAFGAQPGERGFSYFPDYATGYAALKHQIQVDANAGLTILQMMNKYAPASDGNDPTSYAATVAAATGATVNTPVASVVGAGSVIPGTSPVQTMGPGVLADGSEYTMPDAGGISMGLILAAVAGFLLVDVARG